MQNNVVATKSSVIQDCHSQKLQSSRNYFEGKKKKTLPIFTSTLRWERFRVNNKVNRVTLRTRKHQVDLLGWCELLKLANYGKVNEQTTFKEDKRNLKD